MANCMYPLRTSERSWIKTERHKQFRSIIGIDANPDAEDFELTRTEFLMISLLYQMNLAYLIHFLDLVFKYGGLVVCISYIILTGLLGMPLFMLFTFMSSYSKKSYLTFWECTPLFKGVGYSLVMTRIFTEVYNVMAATISLMTIPRLFQTEELNDMKSCNFDDDRCLEMYPDSDYSKICYNKSDLDSAKIPATQYYFIHKMVKYDSNGSNLGYIYLHKNWLIHIACVWVIIFILSVLGIQRIRKVTVNLQWFWSCIIFFIALVVVVLNVSYETYNPFIEGRGKQAMVEFGFWVEIILHSAETNVLCNMIWLGTIKPKDLSVKYAAIIMSPIKVTVFILVACISSVITRLTLKHYRIKDKNCLLVTGANMILVYIPDVLHRFEAASFLNLLWFLGVFYFAFVAPLYTVIGLVDSIIQNFKSLNRHRLIVCMIVCLLGFVLHKPAAVNIGYGFIYFWSESGMILLTSTMMILINLAILYVYSIREVLIDYRFMYGTSPEIYWIFLWKLSPILSIFCFIFVLYTSLISNNETYRSYFMILSFLNVLIAISPIICVMLATCFRHIKENTLENVSKPSEKWGPAEYRLKSLRKKYLPERDVKYRKTLLKCRHRCIFNNTNAYDEEVTRQNIKFEELERKLRDLHLLM